VKLRLERRDGLGLVQARRGADVDDVEVAPEKVVDAPLKPTVSVWAVVDADEFMTKPEPASEPKMVLKPLMFNAVSVCSSRSEKREPAFVAPICTRPDTTVVGPE